MSRRRIRILIVCTIALLAVMALGFVPRIPQPLSYHSFADQRTIFHIQNGLNVLSNLPFLLVGFLGLRSLWLKPARNPQYAIHLSTSRERWSYLVFFLGVFLVGFGSAYYHFVPSNNSLLWDRLPMTLAFLSLLAAFISERIDLNAGFILLWLLIAFGIASVFYWQHTELQGRGDLRPYLFAQFIPLLIIPVMTFLFPPRYTRTADLLPVFVAYGLAKAFEFFDEPIYSVCRMFSGHTLKHLAAAFATYCIYRMLCLRTEISHANTEPST
jgi:predicted membrane channel-forming protein YqfA (hemolysin III family)